MTSVYTIPHAMQALPQWMLWTLIHKEGQDKPSKVPFNASTLQACNPVDASVYVSYAEAVNAWLEVPSRFNGLGFGLIEGLICVDLDNCLDEDGNVTAWARDVLDALPPSFTEISQSGKGLHWFGWGNLPPDAKQKITLPCGNRVELYERKRFMAMTGQPFEGSPPQLAQAQEAINTLYESLLAKTSKPWFNLGSDAPAFVPSHDVVDRMFNSKNGATIKALWYGDVSAHGGDASSADMALLSHLAFFTGKDAQQMETLFSQSVLGQRQKWKTRPDYRERSIQKAVTSTQEALNTAPPHNVAYPVNAASMPSQGGVSSKEWETLKPFKASLLPVPAFDPALIPDEARAWLEDCSERMQAPLDFMAVTLMVTLGSLIGRQLGIRPKAHDSWTVYPNLWGMIIGAPSSMKTPCISSVLDGVNKLESKAFALHEAMLEHHAKQLKAYDMMSKAQDKQLRGMYAKKLKEGHALDLIKEASSIEDVLSPPQPPVCKRYTTNDATVEKLAELLKENPRGLLLYRDELSGFMKKLDKEGHDSDRSFFLETWNGNGAHTVDRIGRGTVRVENLCLSIFGSIQPAVLSKWIHDAVNHTGKDDGFIQRFQMMVWPDVSKVYTHVDRLEDKEAKERFMSLLTRLSTLASTAGHNLELDTPYIHFDKDAQGVFDVWFTEWQHSVRNDYADQPTLEAHFCKYAKLAPALALICHVASNGQGAVSITALMKALDWVEYLKAHAMRIFAVEGQHPMFLAKRILDKLKKGELGTQFTLRDLKRKHWKDTDNVKALDLAMAMLEDHHAIRQCEQGHHMGRPSLIYEVNPMVYTPPVD